MQSKPDLLIWSRDVFYELVREWEDSHSAAGWNMEEHMGDRIRYKQSKILITGVTRPLSVLEFWKCVTLLVAVVFSIHRHVNTNVHISLRNDNDVAAFHNAHSLMRFTTLCQGTLTRLHWAVYNFFRGNFCRCPPFQKQGQTTTAGTLCPTLCEKCVGSLTSPANQYREVQEMGPMVYCPYLRNWIFKRAFFS